MCEFQMTGGVGERLIKNPQQSGWETKFGVDRGELLAFQLTKGNPHDLAPVDFLVKKLFGYLFGDKGYLSKKAFHRLYQKGLKLVTRIRSNMKNIFMSPWENLMLR